MSTQTDAQEAVAIVNAVVYCCDGSSSSFNPGSVIFSDGVITAVGPVGDVEVPESATVIDGRAGWRYCPA